jgi:2-alkyl-3-oxoalkanoate reductase
MRVFVAGASGAIGRRLVPQLVAAGHEVIGTYVSAGHDERIRALGAEPVALDVLDAAAVRQAVAEAHPDAIIHEATALANMKWSRNMDRSFARTNRLRTEGTDALLAAAREAGVRRFVAQSFASYRYAREGSWVKTEDDPLDPAPPPAARETNAAMAHLDKAVTAEGGIALRYGGFYGPDEDGFASMVRKRQYPIVGDGAGVTSWIHLDDAAAATVLALDHDGPAIYHIVDDEPAPMREWLPVFAQVLGAKRPRRVPSWLASLVAGSAMTAMATQSRGADNGRAKKELGWTPRYPSWRQGFVAAYGPAVPAAGPSAAGETRSAGSAE